MNKTSMIMGFAVVTLVVVAVVLLVGHFAFDWFKSSKNGRTPGPGPRPRPSPGPTPGPSPSPPPPKPLFKVGDSVSVSDPKIDVQDQDGCVITAPSSGMLDVCTYFAGNPMECRDAVHTNIDSVKKIQSIKIPCSEGAPNCDQHYGCDTAYEWPKQFPTRQACEHWAGSNSTWGTCVNVKAPFTSFWTLSCNTASDCGKNRECIDSAGGSQVGKVCSCTNDSQCQFPGSEKSRCRPLGIGKMSCPKKY